MEITLTKAALLTIGLIVLGAATIKGVAGMGFPLISVPLVAGVIGPRAAVVIIAIPTLLSNAVMVLGGGGSVVRLRQLLWVALGLIGGAAVGARLVRQLDTRVLALVLGVLAAGYAAAALIRIPVRVPASPRPAVSLGVGAAAGLLGGATTIYAPVLAGYLDSMRLAKNEFVFWISALFLAGTGVQVVTFAQMGIYRGTLLWVALMLCLPMLAGTWAGIRLRGRLSDDRFRTLVLLLVLLSGLNLIVRALWR